MKRKLTQDEMVRAMQEDDTSYDGKFFVCVKTTHIFCLPSCKAKDPYVKNVLFLPTKEKAVEAGFRGCKRCRSEFYPNLSPQWLEVVLAYMRNELRSKIRERDLAGAAKVDISTIRRYFSSYMHTTPMAFHRRLRLQYAKTLIECGTDYLTAAYECGFESSSGFRDAFTKHFGTTPGRTNGKHHIHHRS
jgi:AraC family transcriptional regulator of adaptative response/methylated-DNA-[protein]-cysteine methyltransferase